MSEIDIQDRIAAVHREIGDLPFQEGDGRSVLLRRRFDAPVMDVWAACTDPELIARWLTPVTGDLHPGNRYEAEGLASGQVLRCESPNLVKVTWEYGPDSVTEIEVRLTDAPGHSTAFELEHTSAAATVDSLVRQQGPVGPVGVGAGWDVALLALDHVLSGAPFDRAAWTGGPESRAYARLSHRAWGDAAGAYWELDADGVDAVVAFADQRFLPGGAGE
ncbi:SRPBCC family protein [Streptomyces sp. NPDC058372]|uniref:SRPBCC family protein n=1 Tax=unclassified Streptomyces TaxID=2593676 RepID=UPI00366668E9